MRSFRLASILFLGFLLISCGKAGTHSISLRYHPLKEFPSLQQKMGTTLGIVPFKDERVDTLYIGQHIPLQGISSYFKSAPFPLEKAIADTLSATLSRFGVKTIPVPSWDGKPGSLKNLEIDSILMVEIKRFWTDGKATPFRTHVKTSVHFVIHLGVKKEGKVFTKNVEVEKEMTLTRLTPERVEEMINGIITDIFDSFFSNPYSVMSNVKIPTCPAGRQSSNEIGAIQNCIV